jgi:hypothetical protein
VGVCGAHLVHELRVQLGVYHELAAWDLLKRRRDFVASERGKEATAQAPHAIGQGFSGKSGVGVSGSVSVRGRSE